MAGACRLGDKAKAPIDTHGCPLCPHPNVMGPALMASGNVNINGAPALRAGDRGLHAACCGTNSWTIIKGSGTVVINGQQMVRKGDPTKHCGGVGKMIEASGNVVDGSGDAAGGDDLEELREGILQWLERVQDDGLDELLHMGSPGLGGLYFGLGETGKLFSPECRGTEYFKNLAKCLPGKPPGGDDDGPKSPRPAPRGYHGPPDLGAEPVGLFDPTNPVTDAVMLPFGAVRGAELGVELAPRLGRAAIDAAPKAGKWVVDGVGDLGGSLLGAL